MHYLTLQIRSTNALRVCMYTTIALTPPAALQRAANNCLIFWHVMVPFITARRLELLILMIVGRFWRIYIYSRYTSYVGESHLISTCYCHNYIFLTRSRFRFETSLYRVVDLFVIFALCLCCHNSYSYTHYSNSQWPCAYISEFSIQISDLICKWVIRI